MGFLYLGAAFALAVAAYALRQIGRQPLGNPAEVIAGGGPPEGESVLVCLGDSITQGGLGADWVDGLRRRLGDGVLVVNGGVGGQVTWSLRQRLDEVEQCRPSAIALMVGSNDAVSSLGDRWAAYYERSLKLPEAPTEGWFAEQYDALVAELTAIAPRLLCLTLPPLGEDPDSPAEAVVQRYNELIRASAAQHGADLFDVHTTLGQLLTQAGVSRGPAFVGSLSKFVSWTMGSAIQHYVLGRSWDRVAQRRGLVLTADTIHPSDRAGKAIVDLVQPWVEASLGNDNQDLGQGTP